MQNKKNKVKYNLKNTHYAMLNISEDGAVSYGTPIPMPGSVSISLDANGEPENFYADGTAYYVINNNMGYDGDLELAIPPATQGAAEGGMLMFTAKERAFLTSTYFRLIRQTDDFFEIQSRCTKHCWIVQKLSYDRYPVRIYHKHTKGTAYYHKHGHANTVSSAVRQIKSHDVWQLNGRRTMA